MSTKRIDLVSIRQRQRVLQVLLFTFITVVIWVFFSIFRSQKKVAIDPQLQNLAKPLTPTINSQVLEELATKRSYNASELSAFPIYKIIVSKKTGEERIVRIDSGIEDLDEASEPTGSNGPSLLNSLTEPSPSPSPVASGSASTTPTSSASATPATPTTPDETP